MPYLPFLPGLLLAHIVELQVVSLEKEDIIMVIGGIYINVLMVTDMMSLVLFP